MRTRGAVALGAAVWLSLVAATAFAGPPPIKDNVFLRGARAGSGTATMRSGDEAATDLASAPTVFQVRVLRWYNNAWYPCSGCAVLVYSPSAWLGTYTTDSAGYRNIAGAQYSATKPYLILAGWAAADHSCDVNLNWKNTWSGQLNAGVRKANAWSVTVYASEIKGISGYRWTDLTPRYGIPFADGVYADPNNSKTWILNPMGFENFLGYAGSTVAFKLDGKPYTAQPYDTPKIIGPQKVANYHVYNEEDTNPMSVKDVIIATWWATDGESVGGWSIKTCASLNIPYTDEKIYNIDGILIKTIRHYRDGYDDEPQIWGVDALHPNSKFLERAENPGETGSINSEWQRWRR
ncbi:MAG: hypothetical protein HYV63_31540 [Candidatus Schekmanbacteria bacterium]|nr:hypothetical protein [Candidatus Schekmanbacteria bacterium]